MASADDKIRVTLSSSGNWPENMRVKFTVPACLYCFRPTSFCTCEGNLGWTAEGTFETISIIDKTPSDLSEETP